MFKYLIELTSALVEQKGLPLVVIFILNLSRLVIAGEQQRCGEYNHE